MEVAMPDDNRPTRMTARRLDEIPHAALRPPASERPAGPAAAGPGPAPAADPGPPPRDVLEAEADRLETMAGGTFLYAVLEPFHRGALNPFSYAAYLQRMVSRLAPADPLESMVIEQLALSHYALGRAHVKAANADDPEAARAYYSAAARLQCEFRQSLLALKSYRQAGPAAARAEEPAREVPPARPGRPRSGGGRHAARLDGSELGSNNRLQGLFDELAAAPA
jgi:hypothetical protein